MTAFTTLINSRDGVAVGSTGDATSSSRIAKPGVAPQLLTAAQSASVISDYGIVQLANVQAFPGDGSVYFNIPSNGPGCQIFDITLDVEGVTNANFAVSAYLVPDPTTTNGQIQLLAYSSATALPIGRHISLASSASWVNSIAVQYIQSTNFGQNNSFVRLDILNAGTGWQHYTLLYGVRYFYG